SFIISRAPCSTLFPYTTLFRSFEVANDGDVTALAGAMSLQTNAVLGVAMGSSQAAGFLDAQSRITGWLNELAFAPIDYNPGAARSEEHTSELQSPYDIVCRLLL